MLQDEPKRRKEYAKIISKIKEELHEGPLPPELQDIVLDYVDITRKPKTKKIAAK